MEVTCADSANPGGFRTFTIESDGYAATTSQCYSAGGPDHWVVADGTTSSHATWTAQSATSATSTGSSLRSAPSSSTGASASTSSTPPAPVRPQALQLSRGDARGGASWYDIHLRGYPSSAWVTVTCADSVDPGGFRAFTLATNSSGAATTTRSCYSADGLDHWVTAGGTTSNRVRWSANGASSPTRTASSSTTSASGRRETTGSVAPTHADPANAGGADGPVIASHQTVTVSCRRHGFKVADGNTCCTGSPPRLGQPVLGLRGRLL